MTHRERILWAAAQARMRAVKIFRSLDPVCTCGGPAMGTKHAPDCEIEHKWDEAREQVLDEQWEDDHP